MKHHIEFIGMPASGKTTLYTYLYSRLKKRHPRCYNFSEALKVCERRYASSCDTRSRMTLAVQLCLGRFMLKKAFPFSCIQIRAYNEFYFENIEFISSILATINQLNVPLHYKEMISRWLLAEFSLYHMAYRSLTEQESLVLDEGFCHRTVSLFAHDISVYTEEMLKKYLSAAFIPDIVFAVNLNKEECQKRLSNRGSPVRLARLSQDEFNNRFDFFFDFFEVLKKKLIEKGVVLINIDNCNIEQAKIQIDNAVSRLI
jgi:thymidylate kinase